MDTELGIVDPHPQDVDQNINSWIAIIFYSFSAVFIKLLIWIGDLSIFIKFTYNITINIYKKFDVSGDITIVDL